MKKKKTTNSNQVAKQRLQNIVLNDRIQLSEDILKLLHEDLLGVAEDYFTISKQDSQVYVTSVENEDKKKNVLICVVPIEKVKSRELS